MNERLKAYKKADKEKKKQEEKVNAEEQRKGEAPREAKPALAASLAGQPDKFHEQMEQACQASSKLFKAVTVLEMSKIAGLKVHRGKDPSVELIVQQSDGDDWKRCAECKAGKGCKAHPIRSLGILFPGDMERQRFVEAVIEFHEPPEDGGDDEDESEKDEEPVRDGDDGEGEEDGEDKDLSEEEVVEAHLYE